MLLFYEAISSSLASNMRGVGLLANFSYSMTVLRKSNIFPSIKSKIANAPIIFFGVDRAMNRRMNITARIDKDTRSTLRNGMRTSFAKP